MIVIRLTLAYQIALRNFPGCSKLVQYNQQSKLLHKRIYCSKLYYNYWVLALRLNFGRVVIHSDNQAAVQMTNKGTTASNVTMGIDYQRGRATSSNLSG